MLFCHYEVAMPCATRSSFAGIMVRVVQSVFMAELPPASAYLMRVFDARGLILRRDVYFFRLLFHFCCTLVSSVLRLFSPRHDIAARCCAARRLSFQSGVSCCAFFSISLS